MNREYIVKNPDRIVAEFEDGATVEYPPEFCERVVRCRDCVHSDEDGCTLLDFSAVDWDGNGYCAWGKREGDA